MPSEIQPTVTTGTETILVVEDQLELRQMIKLLLTREGYTVLEAGDGPAARDLLRGRQHPVDLLLTDVVMPFMSGRELVTRLDGDGHSIRVLYMSGYPADDISKHGVLDPAIDFLPKPFRSQQLLTRVRAALDRTLTGTHV